jgi:hypothetical protein
MSRALEAVAIAAIATLLNSVSHAQEKRFEVHGSVVMGSQPFAHVDVWLRGQGTGVERHSVTDEGGAFSISGLAPGQYDLQVGAEPTTVPSPYLPFLDVALTLDRGLTLLLPVDRDFCTQMPHVIHYFRRLEWTGHKDVTALVGTLKSERGAPVDGASVALYVPRLGKIATTYTKRGVSFSFTQLKTTENYWIQVLNQGHFPGEITRLKVLAGYESVYDNLTLEACEPGQCDPSIRKLPIGPGCE